jgi:hypothetical protein
LTLGIKRGAGIDPTLINPPKKKGFSLIKKISSFSLRKSKSSTLLHQIILDDGRNKARISVTNPTLESVTVDVSDYYGTYSIQTQEVTALDERPHRTTFNDRYRFQPVYEPAPAIERDTRTVDQGPPEERSNKLNDLEGTKDNIMEEVIKEDGSATSSTKTNFRVPRRPLPLASPIRHSTQDSISTSMSIISLDSDTIATADSPIGEVLNMYSANAEDVESGDPIPVPTEAPTSPQDNLSSLKESESSSIENSFKPPTRAPPIPPTDEPSSQKDPLGGIPLSLRPGMGKVRPQRSGFFNFGRRPKKEQYPDSMSFARKTEAGPSNSPQPPKPGCFHDYQDNFQFKDDEDRQMMVNLRRMEEEDRILAEELQRIEDEDGAYVTRSKATRSRRSDEATKLKEKVRLEKLERIAYEDALLAAELYRCEEEDIAEAKRQREREEKAEKERLAALERQKQEEQARLLAEQARLSDQQRGVGAPVAVRRVNLWGGIGDGAINDLTPDMLEQLKGIKTVFSRTLPALPVTKVEWIVNEKLQAEFENCKEQLARHGRPTNEIILWHGTAPYNINRYRIDKEGLMNSIITQGFRVGGVAGHPVAHGSSMVPILRVNLIVRA